MQCTNVGQVLARGGTPRTTGNCVASRNQALMSATPIVEDSETGTLRLKSMEDGRQHVLSTCTTQSLMLPGGNCGTR